MHTSSRTLSTFYFVIPSHYILISPHHHQCRRRHWLELAATTTAATTKAVLHSRCLPASSSWPRTSCSRYPHSGYSTRSRSRLAIWGNINRVPKWSASSWSCCSRSLWSWSLRDGRISQRRRRRTIDRERRPNNLRGGGGGRHRTTRRDDGRALIDERNAALEKSWQDRNLPSCMQSNDEEEEDNDDDGWRNMGIKRRWHELRQWHWRSTTMSDDDNDDEDDDGDDTIIAETSSATSSSSSKISIRSFANSHLTLEAAERYYGSTVVHSWPYLGDEQVRQ